MPFPRSRSRPPKLRLPLVLNREECEVLGCALEQAIAEAAPGSDELALLYTLLRKTERIGRKFADEATRWGTDDLGDD
ncbi:hypothetical protein [Gloeobacter kilaueensis]|uniref:Uncharacterized protein n=1 Tax=Gloeobacter kilaueensis (strain ATCC BAA-2537 / CCAP 1431/1 / ULC 316 / JS1) TaxID=1183438 RepID=U5QNQ9_GLOK1|nr:hypothetical protein [Gloeobacter kilaueensis]AGY60566.1 hypothetical protein GKIL_4320 [Gloeobacter kilaueensis JS1]